MKYDGRHVLACRVLIGALCTTTCAVSLAESNATITPVTNYANGRINVIQLRDSLVKFISLPREGPTCSSEPNEPAHPDYLTLNDLTAFEQQQGREQLSETQRVAACEAAQKKWAADYKHAHDELNAIWIPALKKATQLGDPVAEVILRVCDTAPELDRSGIESDCSKNMDEKQFAQTRLKAIGFQPALHKYADTDDRKASSHCTGGDAIRCNTQASIDRYKRIIDVMRSGYLAIAENYNTCYYKSANDELDRLIEECQRYFYLMRAIVQNAEYSYSANLALVHDKTFPGGDSSIRFVTRLDWSPFKYEDFNLKFRGYAEKIGSELLSNIARNRQNDPRWDVFLVKKHDQSNVR